MNFVKRTTVCCFCFILSLGWVSLSFGSDVFWEDKVVSSVLSPDWNEEREFFVYLTEQADLSEAQSLNSKVAKNIFVVESLKETAQRTQPDLLAELESLGIESESFWIVNAILVSGDGTVLQKMARRQG